MIRRPAVYRRKLKGVLLLSFFSLLIFAGVFSVCMGIWILFESRMSLLTPLPKSLSRKKILDAVSQAQNLCVQNHLNCTDITQNNDNTITLTIDSSEQVILSLQKDLPTQIASLQLTIRALTINGKRFRVLDFRFEKPVISY